MSVPRPVVDERAREILDAVDHPISIANAIRDVDGAVVDFSFVFVNRAAGQWADVEPEGVRGQRATAVLPDLRSNGLFDVLARVIETGEPFSERGRQYEGAIAGGSQIDGRYDLLAVRMGDGYLGAWRLSSDEDDGASGTAFAGELQASVAVAQDVVRLVRLETRIARLPRPLRVEPA